MNTMTVLSSAVKQANIWTNHNIHLNNPRKCIRMWSIIRYNAGY